MMLDGVARPWVIEEVEVIGDGAATKYAYPTVEGVVVGIGTYNVDDTNTPMVRPIFVDHATTPTKAVDFGVAVTSATSTGFLAGLQSLYTREYGPVTTKCGACWVCVAVGSATTKIANTKKRKVVFVIQPE